MPNNDLDTHNDGEEKKAQYMAALLNALCPDDPDEAGRRYVRLHGKLAGYFRLKGTYDPVSDADDTLDRAGKKIVEGHNIPDPQKFCIGIAKNIVFERLRERKREENAFQKFIDNNQDNSTEVLVHKITKLIKPCFEKLPEEDRDVLTSYCKIPPGIDRAEHRRQLAESLGLSIAALRIRVTRIRDKLEDCVKGLDKKL